MIAVAHFRSGTFPSSWSNCRVEEEIHAAIVSVHGRLCGHVIGYRPLFLLGVSHISRGCPPQFAMTQSDPCKLGLTGAAKICTP